MTDQAWAGLQGPSELHTQEALTLATSSNIAWPLNNMLVGSWGASYNLLSEERKKIKAGVQTGL